MPDPIETPEVQDEPEIENPVLNDDNIKKMGDKFRELMGANEPDKDDAPDPLKMAPDPKPKDQDKPAKPEEKSAELEPVRDRLNDDSNPRRAEFRKLEQSRDDFRRQAEEHKKAIEERDARLKKMEEDLTNWRKALPSDPQELVKSLSERESIVKERDELVKTLETVNLERSPRFQNWWKTETEKHLKIAQRAVPNEHRDAIVKLLMEPQSTERDSKLDEIIETLPKVAQRTISGAIENLEAVKLQREEALTQGSEQWRKLQEVERREQEQKQRQASERVSKLTKTALEQARTFEAFQEIKDNAEHNSEIAQREAFVTAAIQGRLDEDLAIMLPAAAADGLYLRKTVIPKLKAELEARDKLIKELQATDPRPGSGGGTKQGSSDSRPAEPGSGFAAKVRELMGG